MIILVNSGTVGKHFLVVCFKKEDFQGDSTKRFFFFKKQHRPNKFGYLWRLKQTFFIRNALLTEAGFTMRIFVNNLNKFDCENSVNQSPFKKRKLK